ncbi:MAG: tetratricopeptide repeat protein, partial [Planctomycetales bacterium]|nr:tetratricopeptide repeat protein [Planctomycetales bacterium]
RGELQTQLETDRTINGPTSHLAGPSNRQSVSPIVMAWAKQLATRIERVETSYAPAESRPSEVTLAKATLALATKRFDLASQQITQDMAQLSPDAEHLKNAYVRLTADWHYDQQRWKEAEDAYRRYASSDPNNIEVAERLADCLLKQGSEQQAIVAYEQAADRYRTQGVQELAEWDYGAASLSLGAAVRIWHWRLNQGDKQHSAKLAQAFAECGEALCMLGQPTQAEPFFKNAIQLTTRLLQDTPGDNKLAAQLAELQQRLAVLRQRTTSPAAIP